MKLEYNNPWKSLRIIWTVKSVFSFQWMSYISMPLFNEQRRNICAVWVHTTYNILLLKFVYSNFRIVEKCFKILLVRSSIKISQKRRQSSSPRTHLNFLRQYSLVYNFLRYNKYWWGSHFILLLQTEELQCSSYCSHQACIRTFSYGHILTKLTSQSMFLCHNFNIFILRRK